MVSTIDQIEKKIKQLIAEVREFGVFDESTSLNVHDLLCFMRLAIWENKDKFVEWLSSRTHEINPNILSRVIIEAAEKDEIGNKIDGVELRFHIFENGEETFKHNHRQDFITIPLKGAYEYTWWKVDTETDGEHHVWTRDKGGKLKDHQIKNGSLTKAVLDVQVDDTSELIKTDKTGPSGTLRAGDKPMFVRNDWHHTVHHVIDKGPMITFVVRRGRQTSGTTVLSEWNDAEDGNEKVRSSKKGELTEEEMQEIRTTIVDSLSPHKSQSGLTEFTDLEHYVTPVNRLLCILKEDILDESEYQRRACIGLMKSNNWSFIPLLNRNKQCSDFLASGLFLESRPAEIVPLEQISQRHHLLEAILWTVGLRKFVVPVEKNGMFSGIFSLENILTAEFESSLMLSLTKLPYFEENRGIFLGERLLSGHKLIAKLGDLEREVFNSQAQRNKKDIDNLIHEVLLELGPLIVKAPRLNLGHYTQGTRLQKQDTIQNWARFPMFRYNLSRFDDEDQVNLAKEALRLMKRGNNYSQLALIDAHGATKMLNLTKKDDGTDIYNIQDLEMAPSEMSFDEVMQYFSKSTLPLFVEQVQNQNQKQLGIFTIYELKNPHLFTKFQRWALEKIKMKPDLQRDELAANLLNLTDCLLNEESTKTELSFKDFCNSII